MYSVQRPPREIFIDLRFHSYHTLQWGQANSKKPPVLLLHGWMDVAASWQFFIDALPADFLADRLIIAPDWRGFGQTSGPACDHYVFVDYLGDLDALLAHVAGDRPVDLVGHSMGGNVAMAYAGIRPEKVARLVNLEGFGLPATTPDEAPERYRRWLRGLKALHSGKRLLRSYEHAADVARRLMKTNPRLPPDKAEWLARQWAAPQRHADGSEQWNIRGAPAHRIVSAHLYQADEMLALYRAIEAPVLVIEASDGEFQQDYWQGRYNLDEFHQRLQAVRQHEIKVLPDCSHMLHHDQPRMLARLIADFLEADPAPPA